MEYLCFVLFVAMDVHSSVYIVTENCRDLREQNCFVFPLHFVLFVTVLKEQHEFKLQTSRLCVYMENMIIYWLG